MTINEIAKRAQVSKGTVSKVLNNYPGIRQSTREQVLGVIERLGYAPNSAAQALALRRTGNIGLLIPHAPEQSLSGGYWAALVSIITTEAIAQGFNLVLTLPKEEDAVDELLLSVTRRRTFDGLIVGADLLSTKQLAALDDHKLPFVMLGQNPAFQHYSVDLDNRRAGADITRYLIEKSYRRIAFVAGPAELYYNIDRYGGYVEALDSAGLGYRERLNIPWNDPNTFSRRLSELFNKNRPDAILCGAGGDFMFDCLSISARLGFSVPADGFATFDDYRYYDFTVPRITAVRQPVNQMGRAAVQMLVALMKGVDVAQKNLTFTAELVGRESCGEGSQRCAEPLPR